MDKIFKLLLSAALLLCCIMLNAQQPKGDGSQAETPSSIDNVAYIDANGQQQTVTATVVTNEASTLSAGWYVVTDSNVQTGTLVCNGAVHLILADGAKLTATGGQSKAGITVSGNDDFLTIYGQTAQSGQLIANGGYNGAGIGGGQDFYGSNITINGGTVAANGGTDAAGIGGGSEGSGSNITINGGTVAANGGTDAAGIGGGSERAGSNITINGGTVTATGGQYAAGIGGGWGGSGYNITIGGGTVTANGGYNADCIGRGWEWEGNVSFNIFAAADLIVRAGDDDPPLTVVAAGHTAETDIARDLTGKLYATIGNSPGGIVTYGDYITVSPDIASGDMVLSGTKITFTAADRFADNCEFLGFYKESTFKTPITAGVSGRTYTVTVTETAVSVYAGYRQLPHYIDTDGSKKLVDAAEITSNTLSTGWYVVSGSDVQKGSLTCKGEVCLILADGAKLTVTGGKYQAGITVSGEGNSLAIYGQTAQSGQLIANGGDSGAGIGGGDKNHGSNITINGGVVTANGNKHGAGIGGGYTANGSHITINGGTVTANGGEDAAGIGGGYEGSGSYITINGGTVTATGGFNAAGIGGGWAGYGSDLTINDGTVTANGGTNSAGIGGGDRGSGSDITINGGTVTANGGEDGAGIGGGYLGLGSNIIINDGTITANGGEDGAGIGGGQEGSGSNITINGGTVNANGGARASCIGRGYVWGGNYYSGIFVAVGFIIRADNSNPPVTIVAAAHTAETDIAGDLDGKRYATVRIPQGGIVTYGEYITVIPQFTSGDRVAAETKVTFTAADRFADNYEFIGFYKESTFDTPITAGVSGQTYTVMVLEDDISVYAKYKKFIPTPYIDTDGQEKSIKTTEITSETSTLNAGWYAVLGNDVQTASLTCNGEVHLILADGVKLTATGGEGQAGITVSGDGNSLTIYGQTAQSGQLIAKGGIHAAGIGGEYTHGSNITINGGIITATGGDCGAGIGGGDRGAGYNIIINRGVVTATGGNMASGIGGGFEQSGYDITINGGEVTANGGEDGAGIGGGIRGSGSNIRVAASLTVCADNNNPPMVEILHTSNQDIASSVNKRYVIAKDDATGAKESAIAEIYAAIEGVTNEDIIAIATNAINAINAATSVETVNAIKEQALAAIASAKAAYAAGQAEALGEMGEPCEDCPSVEVTKGTKTVKLYNPESVTFKKE